ncbi:MAG: hypothetical protein ACE5JI_04465 [Acidobacteriota bacterium]
MSEWQREQFSVVTGIPDAVVEEIARDAANHRTPSEIRETVIHALYRKYRQVTETK